MIRIERFAGEDFAAASEAFAILAPKVRAVVIRLLVELLPRMVDREDVAETVLQRLWQNRSHFEPRSVAAWWGMSGSPRVDALSTIGDPKYLPRSRKPPPTNWRIR